MYHKQPNVLRSTQQTQQDIFTRLRECRQQLAIWQRELEDVEQRFAALREREQILQTQLEILHREQHYFYVIREEHERRQREWQWRKGAQ
jgi:hypothetical protein